MSKLQYWVECLSESLQSHGIALGADEINLIAKDIECGHENFHMAFPYQEREEPIPNDKYESLKEENKRLQKDIICYRQSVADRRGVPLHNVYLTDGKVMYDPT